MKIILYIIAIYLVILFLLYLVQRQIIYYPEKFSHSPKEAGVPEMREIKVKTSDNLSIKAWYREPSAPKLPTLVYFHGNAGHIGNRAFIVKPFLNKGFGVLLLTYRGYSSNVGKPHEEGLYKDARAAMEFLKKKKVPSIILYGNSIGGAVAIQMATEYRVKAIVLQSPFSSLAEVGQYHYPMFPIRWFIKDKFNSIKKAEKIKVPVFILHGDADRIIPPKFSKKLYEAFSEPKKIKMIENRGHNDLFEPKLVIKFINEVIAE